MQKQISSKKIMIIICMAAVVILAAVVMLLSKTKKEEFFRSVLVYELEGSAVIERADIGTIDAAENLYLESGDRVSVKEDSMMRIKLDDDKYITAEENTVFSLEAKGDEQDSKTRINLEQGAIINEIQNSLSKESLYETATPNSVMAVRGTVYRAQLYDDEEGGQNMRLCCFQGTVAATPILPDGTFGEEVLVHEGSELIISGDGVVYGPWDINFDSLSKQAIQTLSKLSDNGTVISGITKEKLSAILSSYESSDAGADTLKDGAAEVVEDESSEIAEDMQEASERDTAPDERADSKSKTDKSQADKNRKKGKEDKAEQKTQDTSPALGNAPDTSGVSSSDNENYSQDSDVPQDSDSSQDKGSDEGSGNKPDWPKYCIVTYKYGDKVFATQSVVKGTKAVEPWLAPEEKGYWVKEGGEAFKFTTEIIKENITLIWENNE